MAMYATVLDGVKTAVTKPEVVASVPQEVKKLLDTMYLSFVALQAAIPPELRQVTRLTSHELNDQP